MSKIRLEKQLRLTLPPEIIAQAGLQPNDFLEALYEDGKIILRPSKQPGSPAPKRSIMAFAGACQGAWGDTPADVEKTLAQDRASWDR